MSTRLWFAWRGACITHIGSAHPTHHMSLDRPPHNWHLLDRKRQTYQGHELFLERWVHDASRSGIRFFSVVEAGQPKYVVEGYGVGTINPATFEEVTDEAPIQRSEHEDYQEAREALNTLMEDSYLRWKASLRGDG